MFYWSTKYDFIGEFNGELPETCPVCFVNSSPIYIVRRPYFSVYGLAIFPLKRKIKKACSNCRKRLKLNENKRSNVLDTDPNLVSIGANFELKLKFKYFWGWVIYLPLLALITLLIVSLIVD